MSEVCRWDAYRADHASDGLYIEAPSDADGREISAYPSEACIDHVLGDLGVDVAGFSAVDGTSDPYAAANEFGPVDDQTLLGGLLGGVRGILLMETASIDAYAGMPLVGDAFIAEMATVAEATGVQTLSAAEYNFVTSVIAQTVVGDVENPHGARFDAETQTLHVNEPWGAGDAHKQATLVHEAAHIFPDSGHVPCDSENGFAELCDDNFDHAIGFSCSSIAATQGAYATTYVRSGMAESTWVDLRLINAFNDGGELDAAWRDAWTAMFGDFTGGGT